MALTEIQSKLNELLKNCLNDKDERIYVMLKLKQIDKFQEMYDWLKDNNETNFAKIIDKLDELEEKTE
jgi:low affinity Fe/Cu permease